MRTGETGVRLQTANGTVNAGQAILGLNAWAAGWPGFRLRTLAWGSYMVVTEPIPDRLAELGWTGGELLSDSRFTISYFRTTRDGRIAFGAGVGAAGFDGRIGDVFTHDVGAIERVVANFRHLLPMLSDVRFEAAWGGPIDITADRFPEIGSKDRGRVHYAHGFAGNGVGRLGWPAVSWPRWRTTRTTPSPACRSSAVVSGRFQPEPLRFVGARLIRGPHPPGRRLGRRARTRIRGARPRSPAAPVGVSARSLTDSDVRLGCRRSPRRAWRAR